MPASAVGDRAARRVEVHDFPHGAPIEERLRFLLRYAVLAPSSHNTQPWRFEVKADTVEAFGDGSRWLRVADPDRREMHISVGCAVENLLVAGEHFGLAGHVAYGSGAEEEGPVASVQFGPRLGDPEPPWLFAALTRRRTPRDPFAERAVALEVLDAFHGCVEGDDLHLWLVTDPATRHRVEDLVALADREAYASPEYRRELARWVGAGAFGTGWVESQVARLAVAALDLGPRAARRDAALVASAPVVGILTSSTDDRPARVRIGRVYERISLVAASLGIGVQPLSTIVQVPETRRAIAELIPGPYVVQQPFRAGYGLRRPRATPRRPVEDVLS